MTRYFILFVVLAVCYTDSNATPSCEERFSQAYLDVAVNMITKAKNSILPCDCGKNLTRGTLDCSDLLQMGYKKSGVYTIWPVSRISDGKSLEVYCDMETDGGGWTVIQRRGDFGRSNDYFFKEWKSYKEGFGHLEREFWLGNDNIYALTNQKLYSVRFDLKDVEKNKAYALYDTFWIDEETRLYTLHIADYSGEAGDSLMSYHNNQKFTTKDQDNDENKVANCAQSYKGGWWYKECHAANLNGLYLKGKNSSEGVSWRTWKGYHVSLESTEIKIRPKKFKLPQVSFETPM